MRKSALAGRRRYHAAMKLENPTPEAHVRWHAQRLDALRRPDGWLTLVGLVWLDDGERRVGSASDCDIVLPNSPAWLGTLHVDGRNALWTTAGGELRPLRSDADGTPDVVAHGSASFFLIERDGRLAARVRDTEAATRRKFAGIDCYPFDPAWCVAARWDGAAANFSVDGQAVRLSPQDSNAETLHFVIADATSGRETYGGGRFLFAPATNDGNLQLDFNRAINPPCAFTPFAVCPLPPAGNRMPVAIRAGEKIWRGVAES